MNINKKAEELFPRAASHLPSRPVFVALKEDISYYNDGERMDYLSLEVIGDNIEQANAWVTKREETTYAQRPYRVFKLIPVTIQRTVTISIHEQA